MSATTLSQQDTTFVSNKILNRLPSLAGVDIDLESVH